MIFLSFLVAFLIVSVVVCAFSNSFLFFVRRFFLNRCQLGIFKFFFSFCLPLYETFSHSRSIKSKKNWLYVIAPNGATEGNLIFKTKRMFTVEASFSISKGSEWKNHNSYSPVDHSRPTVLWKCICRQITLWSAPYGSAIFQQIQFCNL